MNKTDTGGPAFPALGRWGNGPAPESALQQDGMTLRDYFAAKAMQAYITIGHTALGKQYSHNTGAVNPIIAMASYETADAMLAARKGGAA